MVGGTFFYGLGASLPQFVRFLLLPVFTRDSVGRATMASSRWPTVSAAFLQTPMRMGVPNAVTRFYFDYPEGPKLRDYITSVSWFVAICSLGVGSLALLMFPLVGGLLPGLPLMPFAVLAVVGGILSSNQEMQNRLVQAREQAAYAARLNIGRAGLSIALAAGVRADLPLGRGRDAVGGVCRFRAVGFGRGLVSAPGVERQTAPADDSLVAGLWNRSLASGIDRHAHAFGNPRDSHRSVNPPRRPACFRPG